MYEDIKEWAKLCEGKVDEPIEEDRIDDILARGNEIKARRDAEAAAEKAAKLEQKVKSIWVKAMNIDPVDENKSVATLVITYVDGHTSEGDFPIGTSNAPGKENRDKLYKQCAKTLRATKNAQITDTDIRLSMIRVSFNDHRITWYYGPRKVMDAKWAFSSQQDNLAKNPGIRRFDPERAAEVWMEEYMNAKFSGSSDPEGDADYVSQKWMWEDDEEGKVNESPANRSKKILTCSELDWSTGDLEQSYASECTSNIAKDVESAFSEMGFAIPDDITPEEINELAETLSEKGECWYQDSHFFKIIDVKAPSNLHEDDEEEADEK